MKKLYDLTPKEVIDELVDRVIIENPEVNKKTARALVLNSLIYNCVIDEILGQVNYLLDREEEDV